MRTKVALFASIATAALLAGMVSPGSALTRPQVFSLLDVEETETALGPGLGFSENAPPTLGARFAFTDGLYKWAGRKRGARVGRIEGLCTFTKVDLRARAVTIFCNATAYLPAGQILLAAHIRFTEQSRAFRVVVIGGTGGYVGARGFAKITNVGPEESGKSNIEFHLLP